MEIKRIEGEIEAILFAMGEAVELPRIARAIRQDPTTTENIIRNMMIRYQEEERGIQIIAYKQPVTKAEIDKIRGVKCDHAINKLMDYDLVRELGRLDAPGRPILLGTTEEFLRCFGVQGLEDLPEMDPVQLEDFKAEAEEEIQLKLDV